MSTQVTSYTTVRLKKAGKTTRRHLLQPYRDRGAAATQFLASRNSAVRTTALSNILQESNAAVCNTILGFWNESTRENFSYICQPTRFLASILAAVLSKYPWLVQDKAIQYGGAGARRFSDSTALTNFRHIGHFTESENDITEFTSLYDEIPQLLFECRFFIPKEIAQRWQSTDRIGRLIRKALFHFVRMKIPFFITYKFLEDVDTGKTQIILQFLPIVLRAKTTSTNSEEPDHIFPAYLLSDDTLKRLISTLDLNYDKFDSRRCLIEFAPSRVVKPEDLNGPLEMVKIILRPADGAEARQVLTARSRDLLLRVGTFGSTATVSDSGRIRLLRTSEHFDAIRQDLRQRGIHDEKVARDIWFEYGIGWEYHYLALLNLGNICKFINGIAKYSVIDEPLSLLPISA